MMFLVLMNKNVKDTRGSVVPVSFCKAERLTILVGELLNFKCDGSVERSLIVGFAFLVLYICGDSCTRRHALK